MKKVEIELKSAEYYVEAINNSLEVNTSSNIRLSVTEGTRSIEIGLKKELYIKSALLNLTDAFYQTLEAEFKKLGVPGYVNYNNTKDIISYWIDSNTKAWY